ncbi:MAG: hypothetical protein ACYC7E_12160 [Armatimonadota bacterium]
MPTRHLILAVLISALLPALCGPIAAQGPKPLATFSAQEVFGVPHPEQVIDFDLPAPVDPKTTYLIGPNGNEAPYQVLEGGKKVAVRTGLPACRYPVNMQAGYFPTRWKLNGLDNFIHVNGDVAAGDAVRFSGAHLPAGITAGKTYFIREARVIRGTRFATLAETRGGELVAVTREGNDTVLTRLAWCADPATNRIHARGHGLRDGDPVRFRAVSGTLPEPLSAETTYRVRNSNDDSFQLSIDARPTEIITLKALGEGLYELLIDWSWRLYAGRAPARFPGGVAVTRAATGYEITNGLTGVRIPQPPAILTPTPAPVQGIRQHDGTWTAGANYLSLPAKAMTVKFLESGPLKAMIEVRYTFDRPEKSYGERKLSPAGEGYYTSTITVEAGQPSVLFTEESDCDLSYSFPISDGLQPTKARYRGHHSNSKEAGYEADGRQYRMWHERPGMDAFVDLRYDVPRDYRKVAVWDPWIFDGGWYWQFYNDAAPETANLLGIFAGRASQGIGTPWSGANFFTAPQGITDLTTQADAAGNLHAVYRSGDALWYVKFDRQLNPGKPAQVAAGIIYPDLLVREDGSVAITGYDVARKAFVRIEPGAGGAFSVQPIAFTEGDALQPTQPYLYQASSAGIDYLFLFGKFKEQAGGLLFARKPGEARFTFQEAVKGAACHRQIERPVFTRLANGDIRMLFSNGQYAEVGSIAKGATSFAGTANQRALFNNEATRLLNFGSAVDPASGAALIGDQRGVLTYLAPDGKIIASPPLSSADHHGQGPNRRTLAVAADSTALAVHNGEFFLLAGGAWSKFAAGNAVKLVNPRAHYLNGQFVLLGRKDGILTAATWKPGEAAPQIARQLSETDRRVAGLTVIIERGNGNPSWAFTSRVRYSWGLFTGSKDDLADPYQVQPIARQMNIHAGINLQKMVHWQLDFPDPKKGYGSPFADKAVVQRMIEKLRADKGGKHGGGYYQYLYNAESYSRPLIDMWADSTGIEVANAVAGIVEAARSLLDGYVNGDGIYDMHCHYWHGGLAMSGKALWGDQVLASQFITPGERAKVKAALALFGNILWDEDYVPLNGQAWVNLGTENMPVQQIGYRRLYTMMLAEHPTMRARALSVADEAVKTARGIVNESGAEIGCVHYIAASFAPTLMTLLQVKGLGLTDPFKTEPRLGKFADFFMHFQTPPEIRFGAERKNISTGDGPTESSEMFGMLGTGLRDADPDRAAKAMWSWHAGGKPHSGFFGTTLLMIDEDAPTKDPQLGNAAFPGYYAVLRHGWGTPNETALWLLSGDFYRDHRHHDRGGVIMYALGVPLSLDWGPQYAPHTPGGIMHSVVLPESMLGQPWDQDVKNLGSGGSWGGSTLKDFAGFKASAFARGVMASGKTQWTRETYSLHPNEAYPILVLRDRFEGEQANAAKVFTLNLMAEGPVQTPAGPVTPPARTWGDGYNDKIAHESPSAGQVFALPAGLNKLIFTGATFGTKEKPTLGIDFDLYTVSDEAQQAHIGNWADNWVGGASGAFQRVNGRPYEERQHILRIRGTGEFTTLILPYRKGQPRETQVTREGGLVIVRSGDERTVIGDGWYSFVRSKQAGLATFSGLKATGEGMTIEGGPAEVLLDAQTAVITLSGVAGTRTVTLPGAWKLKDAKAPAKLANGVWQIDYAGGDPLTVMLVK